MKKIAIEELVAKKIVDVSMYGVKNTVGKCWPALVHEVKMPDCIKKEFMNQNMDTAE